MASRTDDTGGGVAFLCPDNARRIMGLRIEASGGMARPPAGLRGQFIPSITL